MEKKRALITGCTGQDFAWLADLLLKKDYEVFGTDRRISSDGDRYWRLKELGIFDQITLVQATLESYESLIFAVSEVFPHEVYSLAANSFVADSFADDFSCYNINFLGVHRLLRACQKFVPDVRFYQASSSEQYGRVEETPQSETTRFHPRSPYGISKVAAFELVRHARERGMFACNGILFNHESQLRGEQFVTRKITKGAAAAVNGGPKIRLGNLDAQRDWGHARDYVFAMWAMLQCRKADDYVIATGHLASVAEFLQETFAVLSELAGRSFNWKDYVEIDKSLLRPTEVDLLLGDATKARRELDWIPKTDFKSLVREMVEADLGRLLSGKSR